MMNDWKLVNAALTLEAAIVIPICLFATMILLTLVLVLHDYAALVGFEHQVLEEFSTLENDYGNIYDSPIAIKETVSPKRPMLFIAKSKEISYKLSVVDYVLFKKVKIECSCPMVLMGIDISYDHESEQVVTSGPEVVRLMTFLNDITSDQVLLGLMKQYFDYGIKAIEAAIEAR